MDFCLLEIDDYNAESGNYFVLFSDSYNKCVS